MQTSYQDQKFLPALEGGLYDVAGIDDIVSMTPGNNVKQVSTLKLTTVIAAVAQVATLTVDTAADGDAYTLIIGGHTFTGTTSGTDDAAQAAAIRTQLGADANFAAQYTIGGAGADVVITAKRLGVPFGFYETVEATSAWSWALTTPATIGTQIKLTINGYEFVFPCDSTSEENERDSLLTALQADSQFTDVVDMAADDSEDPVFNITFTAKTAGTPFTLTFANETEDGEAGSGSVALEATTANVTGTPIPFGRAIASNTTEDQAVLPSATGFTWAGVSVNRATARKKDNTVSPPVTKEAEYDADEPVPVLRRHRIWVDPEDTPTVGGQVHIRHTAGVGAGQTVGRFRGATDAGKTDQVTAGARWLKVDSNSGLALLEFDALNATLS